MHTLDRSRPTIGAQAVGIAQGSIDYAGEYMKGRKAFGRPIADLQGLRFMLADMAMRTEAARALVYRACATIDAGDPEGELSVPRRGGQVLRVGHRDERRHRRGPAPRRLRLHPDFPVERYMRDAKITQIYEGTNQIQRVVIAKHLLG